MEPEPTTPRRLVVLGDSIGAAQGVAPGAGFVALLSARLAPHGCAVRNWSRGGLTAAAAAAREPLARVSRRLREEAAAAASGAELAVLVELGGNDRLFGVPSREIESALEAIVGACRDAAPAALVLVLEVIPDGIERDAARRAGARLVPCPARVAATMRKPLRRGAVPPMSPLFMQPDRIHPNDAAQPLIADEVLDALRAEWGLPGGREPAPESASADDPDPERRGVWCQCVVT